LCRFIRFCDGYGIGEIEFVCLGVFLRFAGLVNVGPCGTGKGERGKGLAEIEPFDFRNSRRAFRGNFLPAVEIGIPAVENELHVGDVCFVQRCRSGVAREKEEERKEQG
jgi:hypothetical protein